MILNQVCDVAPQGTFDNVWRHLGWSWLPGQVKWRWHLVCRDEGCCCECPTMHVAAPITNNDPAPKISSAKAEELCSKPLPCWSGSSSLPYRYISYMPLIWLTSTSPRASQMTQHKESTCQCKRHGFDPWVRKDPLEKGMAPTPVFLPGESMDRGAWWAIIHGVTELDTT